MRVRFLCLLLTLVFGGIEAKATKEDTEEGIELRHIAEYWKEKEYGVAKSRIENFLQKRPMSAYADQLQAMLGDLFFLEQDYGAAIHAYEKVISKEFQRKSQCHYLQSLYNSGQYDRVISHAPYALRDPHAASDEVNAIRFMLAESRLRLFASLASEEEKTHYLKSALCEYQQLMHTSYSEEILLPQAQIYALLKDYTKAVSLYSLLAQKKEALREECLFQIACLQLHFDTKAAAEQFAQIWNLGSAYAAKAAFNHLNLLFQEKEYAKFVLNYEKAITYVPEGHRPYLSYALGKSLFGMKDYLGAVTHLSHALATKKIDSAQEKGALVALAACAQELKDSALLRQVSQTLLVAFSQAEETQDVALSYLAFAKESGEWADVRSLVNDFLQIYPQHPLRLMLRAEYALAFVQEKNWHEGAQAIEQLLETYPPGDRRTYLMRQWVQCHIEEAKAASAQTQRVAQGVLAKTLAIALDDPTIFSKEEQGRMQLLLGKTLVETGQIEAAQDVLKQYIAQLPSAGSCKDAYLLLSLCYQHTDLRQFVEYAEKALALDPHHPTLRLNLYNAYLALASEGKEEEKADYIEKAAEHLFASLHVTTPHNQRWLAHYYSQLLREGHLEKAICVLKALLEIQEDVGVLQINAQSMEKESEALKLAELYAQRGAYLERIALLESLTKRQQEIPELPWKYQRMAIFELAISYLHVQQSEKALDLFDSLLTTASSYYATAAKLEKAKLQFSLLPETEKKTGSARTQELCDILKEIQILRRLHSEPLHLEAALSYIDIKAYANRASAYPLLCQMKNVFFSLEDPLVQQYLSCRAQFPEKEQLFLQYMQFVDLAIKQWEAIENNEESLRAKIDAQLKVLHTHVTDKSLKNRIGALL